MSSTNRPAVVFAHGAWHQGLHWSSVASKLEAAGYEVSTPTMPSVSGTALEDALHADSAALKTALETLTHQNKDVVLVMHSYGGKYGSEAVAEFHLDPANTQQPGQGRILHLLYVSAIIIPQGKSNAEDANTSHTVSFEDGLLHHLEPHHRFYELVPPATARHCISHLRPQSASGFTTKTLHRGWADHDIPVTYLACKQDKALVYDPDLLKFAGRIRDAGVRGFELVEMEADHTPWLSREEEFMGVVLGVLKKAEEEARRGTAKI
ncbi:hypothetical protein M409DRAFT_27298 [Zasmidium cellare ATCC 36951]|uniref:AB hydrolase-1 domain-containing protein n=1 Tax=Zasmidium cellare ATCC 36951 TaxID=1080233 RepID=A0A6A6C5B6_ZASCE|nr:uncharacterized protein M409DRAFT_27298 [Zasmidium cellare ATCC 36951]KAF2162294.1 hypothetical protein M409DRAFT_27298 [Zasmidium cellare ATCC 36951]